MPINPSQIVHPGTLSTSQSAAGTGTAYASDAYGPTLFVNSVTGQAGNSGLTPANPLATMEAAFALLETWQAADAGSSSNATIYVSGDVREQLTAPLGVFGVKIKGLVGGNPRNTTADGVVLPGNGVAWRAPASPTAGVPLLTLREQGWEIHDLLFYTKASIASVRLRCDEVAGSYPDASHAKFKNVRFMSESALGTPIGTGIGDYGGAYNVSVENCQFINLEYAIHGENYSIRTPLMWRLSGENIFQLNKNDILTNASGWVIQGQPQFMTVYHGTTHPNTLNLADTGTGTYPNRITNAIFAEAIADITVAKGYKPGNAADVWRYYASATAAFSVTTPT